LLCVIKQVVLPQIKKAKMYLPRKGSRRKLQRTRTNPLLITNDDERDSAGFGSTSGFGSAKEMGSPTEPAPNSYESVPNDEVDTDEEEDTTDEHDPLMHSPGEDGFYQKSPEKDSFFDREKTPP
jgi:hypothetical protein